MTKQHSSKRGFAQMFWTIRYDRSDISFKHGRLVLYSTAGNPLIYTQCTEFESKNKELLKNKAIKMKNEYNLEEVIIDI